MNLCLSPTIAGRTASVLALATSLLAAPANAQEAGVADEDLFAEIVVTAQKTEQRIQDVPVTITAFSGEQLGRIGIEQMDQLSAFVPGLNIQEQSPNNPGFVIRGITSDSGSAQASARVTIYYSGVDVSRSRGSYFDLFDLERVEVVKGPQATLFGTAAAIGALSVIPAPVREGISASLTGGVGNFNQRSVRGHVNAGTENYGFRLAFAWRERDGVVENISGTERSLNPGSIRQDDLNGQNQLGIRGSIMLRPVEDLRLDLVVTYDGQRNPGTAFKSGSLPPSNGDTSPYTFAELGGSPFSRTVLGNEKLGLTRNVYDVNLTARFARPDSPWSITSVTGYREFDSLEVFDADGSAAWFLEFAEDATGRQFSQELRVNYDSDTIRAFAGVNYFTEKGFQRVPFSTEEGIYLQCVGLLTGLLPVLIPGVPCVAPNGTVPAAQVTQLVTQGLFRQLPYDSEFQNGGKNDLFSVFADVTWLASDALELSAGARVTWETRRSFYTARQPNSRLLGLLGLQQPLLPAVDTRGQTFRDSDTNTSFLPRFNILWRASDQLNLYATVSKGQRSPVLQLDAVATPAGPVARRQDVPAESIWNIEGGLKGSAGGFSGSLGVFQQFYDNFQVTIQEGGQLVTRNAGSAKNFGVEAEASYRIIPGVTAFGSVGYIDAKIDNKPENGIFAGQRFRLQSKWQAALGLDARFDLGGGFQGFFAPSLTHQSKLFFELPNTELISQGPATLVNVRAGFTARDGRIGVTGFGRNIFNERYLLDAGNTGDVFGTPTFIRGLPALYGIELTLRY
ncbi:MAG: TonB-dependent receptor [Thermaurantiacus sp.]